MTFTEVTRPCRVRRLPKGHDFFPHRALAALAAMAERFLGDNAAALAAPPLSPPMRPKATAWGFLVGSGTVTGSNFGAWSVDSSMIWYASWLGSRGRAFFDRSGIPKYRHIRGARSRGEKFTLTHYRSK